MGTSEGLPKLTGKERKEQQIQEAIRLAEDLLSKELWDAEKCRKVLEKLEKNELSAEMKRRLMLQAKSLEEIFKRYKLFRNVQIGYLGSSALSFLTGNAFFALAALFVVGLRVRGLEFQRDEMSEEMKRRAAATGFEEF